MWGAGGRAGTRIDHVEAQCAGDRDAVASVEDVEAVGPLDHRYRWERSSVAVGARDALPALADAIGRRPEVGVEVAGRVHGSDDGVERNRSQSRRAAEQRGDAGE